MFRRRALTHYSSSIRTIDQGLSGLAYRTKRLLLVLIMSLLSFTQLPEMFAQEVVQQATAMKATMKKQRVVNLYKSKAGSGSIASTTKNVSSNSRQKSLSGVVATGTLLFNGPGSCVWDMATMQWTGIQTHIDTIDRSSWIGSRSGFDGQTMGLSYGTGILLHQALVDSGNYLMMRNCIRSGSQIIYPGEQEYLSGLILFSGELLELPSIFTGVWQSAQYLLIADAVVSISGSSDTHSGGRRRDQSQSTLASNRHDSNSRHVVQNPQELLSKIEAGVMLMQQQKVKRARDTGKPNKLQLTNSLTYITPDSSVSAELSSGTTIFTAQGQELQVSQFTLQEIETTPSYKKSDQASIYSKDMIEWGTPGDHLIFTQPIMITYQSDLPDGSPVWLQVQHAGQDWSTQGLSLDPNTQCDIEGNASLPGSKTSVQGGQIQFYTCGASIFNFTYTGGANFANFVDNGSLAKTITIATGDVSSGFTIYDLNVSINRQAIDSEDPTNFTNTNAYPSEKSFTITSPGGVTRTLIAAATYADGVATGVVTVLDDQAGALPSGLPVSGTFLPNQGLNAVYSGINPIGTWTLTMGDNAGQDGVILHGFNLQMANLECGDGLIMGGEQCDDSNTNNGDGCSLSCQVEAGRTCSGQPSSCSLIPAPSGLRFHLDGSMTGALFRDIAGSGFDAANFNGSTTGNQNGETTMCFNGTNQYLERATNFATAYPFTMSVWMKSDVVTGLHGVMSYARSTAANIMYNIEHNATTIRQNAQNTTARYANASTALTTTDWFLVTAVYTSATSRTIYVNGVQAGTNATAVNYDTNVTKRINIGRLADSTPTNYFDGCVDDVRFYTTALTSGQVYGLYAKPAGLTTSLVATGSPQLTGTIGGTLDTIILTISGTNYTGTNNGNGTWTLATGTISPALVNGTYVTTMLVTNPYGRAVTYTGSFVVSIPPAPTGTICIESPDVLSVTGTQGTSGGVWEAQFDYFQVQDTKGINSGYYTTLSMTSLSGPGGSIIGSGLLEWRGDPITTLSGTTNPRVVVGSVMSGTYAPANVVTTFIKRDTAANSNVKGEYGSRLWLKVSIPPYQAIGLYTGTITYTLYEN